MDARGDDVMARALLVLLLAGLAAGSALGYETRNRNVLHAAIAYHEGTQAVGWSTDRRTSREASTEALKQCGHENCVVVGSVSRGCLALARASAKPFVEKGATRQEAETKALKRCGQACEISAWTCTR
ncbi:MAG: DUF4189 domain-containing protein [Betaproteobacteria bacterium]|nr:DUF4189 domain-containing protein [Betaproteobacteria bacterium]